ncbi:MAG: arylsulfatase [Inquilinus sp.]|uniref:arylsulfatase n=1 Tax=Inquilinus sp. TaxID=1932117 RepID=UPI003F2F7183
MDPIDRTPETVDIDGKHPQGPTSGAGVSRRKLLLSGTALAAAAGVAMPFTTAEAQTAPTPASPAAAGAKPNIVVIMGDDVGWFNIGAYHRGIMSGKTPNLDKLASEGMMFTDYYAEASCTAGRASFITGEIPLRTGLTTVGQAGADVGMPDKAATIASALKVQGYATGQFGKNHLGDLNKYLPTLHGFDEFFGYLYHLDAMSDPYWYSFPDDQAYRDQVGPRNLVHSWAADTDDPIEQPRWGKVGKQRIVDEGPLAPFPDMSNVPNMHDITPKAKYDMGTFDEVLVKESTDFMDKAKADGKPFFVWHNTTRMHVWTFLSPKYRALMNSQTNYGLEEAGMAQLDDSVGTIMKHLDDIGEADNTIVIFTTDNGAEVFTWPDGGMTPFKGTKGTVMEGGFRAPAIIRWPGKVKPGTVENGIFSALDWFPTLLAAAGNPDITDQLLKGVQLGDRSYKNHLDGYNQLDLLLGKAPSARHEFFYFGGPQLGAIRIDNFKYQFYQQPEGWPGQKETTDMPTMVNIRQDPFERTPSIGGQSLNDLGGGYMNDFYAREFWRFVTVQEQVKKLALTAIDYPPMQDPASFNLDAVKKQIDEAIRKQPGN